MPGTSPPGSDALRELLADVKLLHARCGRPIDEHPHAPALEVGCPFPPLAPIEFAQPEPEVRVRVCGLPNPGRLSPELESILGDLARRVREEYGIGVEVTADDDLDEVRAALDTIRRRLDL